jgi:multicomponent Na+:H+ antiporter subunit E
MHAPGYWTWLSGQILGAASRLARRIWTPGPAVQPVMRTIPAHELSETGQVIYANSITLTPGTLSVTVDDRGIGVHALDDSLAGSLDRDAMISRIRRMELN